jgi:uncharacterized protein YkwD
LRLAERRSAGRRRRGARSLIAVTVALVALAGTGAVSRALASSASAPRAPETGASGEEAAVLRVVNQARAKRGLTALSACRSLARAAREHSTEMRDRDRVGHDSRGGTSLLERACGAGFGRACRSGESVAETVAAGQRDASRVLAAWLASPRHRRIVLDPDLNLAGAGYAHGGRLERYWTVIFASGTDPSCGARGTDLRGSRTRALLRIAAPARELSFRLPTP